MLLAWLERYNARVSGGVVPLALILVGGYFFVCLRGVWMHPIRLVRRMLARTGAAGTSPLRAMSLSLAGVLGVGNLVGVAGAIQYGGAGAVFWMWISATVAMLLKYAEVVLALRHRRRVSDRVEGAAMYYIEDSFPRRRRVGRWLGSAFALLLLLDAVCMGCVIQTNAVSAAFGARLGVKPLLCGFVIATTVLVVGLSGDGRIAALAQRMVPVMTLGFCLLGALGIASRWGSVLPVLHRVVKEGVSPDPLHTARGMLGGVGAVIFSRAVRFGTMRGLLSNEAGCGTAPLAHADSATDDAVAQGGLGMLEVFVDTHLLCSITALIILLAYLGEPLPTLPPMVLTVSAFERLLGKGAGIFLCIAVLCFGLATVLCWSHYALRAGAYLFPCQKGARFGRVRDTLLLLLYGAFAFSGAFGAPESVWQLSDLAIGSMTLLNLWILWRSRTEICSVHL